MSKQQIVPPGVLHHPLPPFLRWAGGKRGLTRTLISHLPSDFHSLKYHEPFLGAGSLFFSTPTKAAVLADANRTLISAYLWIRRRPKLVYSHLSRLLASTTRHITIKFAATSIGLPVVPHSGQHSLSISIRPASTAFIASMFQAISMSPSEEKWRWGPLAKPTYAQSQYRYARLRLSLRTIRQA